MAITKFDTRQTVNRSTLAQIAPNQTGVELDNLLTSIDSDLTNPLRMDASSTPDLVITIGSGFVSNSESNRQKALAHINDIFPSFTGGTVTLPASSGGNITFSPGATTVLTVSSGNYIKATIYLDDSGNLGASLGTEAGTEAGADVPITPSGTLAIGYVVIHNTGGTIDNVTQNNLYQFPIGSGGSGGTSGLTTDLSSGSVSISTGTTLMHPYLIIDSGDTYTVNGQLVSVDTLTVNGTLTINAGGTVNIL